MILIYLKERRHLINSARNAFFLITPLSITVILFCYYNYVRFNSISDTGFFYQLTSTTISQPELAAKHLIFSPLYIAINFWQYFLFPYVGAKIPPLYYSGGTVGLLILNHSFLYLGYSTLLYLIAKILLFKRPIFSYKNSQPIISSALIFGILFAIQLLPLLLNMNSEMRYYNDFIYAFYLSIFLFIYFFLRLILIKKNIISYVIYFIFGACIFISISFQLLVSVNYYDALKSGNPTLFNNIILKHEGIISRIYPFNLKK